VNRAMAPLLQSSRDEQLTWLYHELRRRHYYVTQCLKLDYGGGAEAEDMAPDYERMRSLRRVMDKVEKRVPFVRGEP
jgi:hypothetical protein